jgi:adenylate cyclase
LTDRRANGYRFDLEFGELETDPSTGRTRIEVLPNRERYNWVKTDRGMMLYDKYDDLYLEPHLIEEAIQYFFTHRPLSQPQLIGDAREYWTSRIPLIRESLRHGVTGLTLVDKSEQFLEELSADRLNFVIMVVDIVGSTRLATTMKADDYTLLLRTALFEISEIVPKFRGYVLKYTGDGIIAYFPEPTFIAMNDLAIDCALTIRGTIRNALNLVMPEIGLPQISLRTGIDAGETVVTVVGSQETKQHKDLIGQVVSLAAKIQGLANPNEILYGEAVERHLHSNWRKQSVPVPLPADWPYNRPDGQPYMIFKTAIP